MRNQTRVQNADVPELEEEEEAVEKLEENVKEMGQKIQELRRTLPNQLNNKLTSLLQAQRPIFLHTRSHDPSESQPGPSSQPTDYPDFARSIELGNEACLAIENQEDTEKLRVLKEKISSNASKIPNVLKRIKECMERMEKVESYDGVIHPAFKRKRRDLI